jgi:hypothetical protein
MMDLVLGHLRQELSDHLARAGGGGIEAAEDAVVFPNGQKPEPEFKLGAVTLMLAGVQHEPVMRPADRHLAVGADGSAARVRPPLHLQLMVLAAARHGNYAQSLRALSLVAGWAQANPVVDRASAPGLDPAVERFTVEFISLTLAEQNELWSALGTGYLPSLLLRVRVLVIADAAGQPIAPVTAPERVLLHHGG